MLVSESVSEGKDGLNNGRDSICPKVLCVSRGTQFVAKDTCVA